nr:hypothetical protein HAGR004_16250 [Bdellovibrio sp. HAGR004]
MLQDLRGETQGLRFFHFLNPAIPSRGQPLPHWNFVVDTEEEIDAKKMAAYAFAQQLTINGFVNLKRCHLKSCQNFFIGRSNTKWCSKSCGSFYRVTKKRKKDKN